MNKKALFASATLILAASAVALLLGVGRAGQESAAAWPVTRVALASVERHAAPRALHAAGELEAAQQVELASESAGRITRIAFDSGQRVEKGQLLVQLNDAPEQAERLRLRAQLHNARVLLERTRTLQQRKVTSQERLDNAQAAFDMARGELQRVEAQIAQKAIRAPFNGVIGIRRVHLGQYLQAGTGIASLVDAGTLRVNFALEEQALPSLHPGQPLELRLDAWPQRSFPARISAIDPLVGRSRTVQVQARLDNREGLLQAGMYAGVRVLHEQPSEVLAIPETAVTYSAYGQSVFIAEADEQQQTLHVRRVAVKTGERWQGRVEILSGLAEGQRVVVSGQIKLADGMPVEALASDTLQAPRGDEEPAR